MLTTCLLDNFTFFVSGILLSFITIRLAVAVNSKVAEFLLGSRSLSELIGKRKDTSEHVKLAPTEGAFMGQQERNKKVYSLRALEDYHQELDARFARHQELLVSGHIKKAYKTLDFYKKQLSIRLAEEAQIIIPLYKTNAPLPEKERERSAQIYLLEHKRCLSILDEAEDCLKELLSSSRGVKPRDILHILELESRFRDMLHRHDGRELRDLYPGAEYNTSELQRKRAWEDSFKLRASMGFRLGTLETLTVEKISLVRENWSQIRDQFPIQLAKYSEYEQLPLPISDKSDEQGYQRGALEAKFLDDVFNTLNHIDSDVIHSIRSKFVDFQLEDFDQFIQACLVAVEGCQHETFNHELREAYANALNVTLATTSIDTNVVQI